MRKFTIAGVIIIGTLLLASCNMPGTQNGSSDSFSQRGGKRFGSGSFNKFGSGIMSGSGGRFGSGSHMIKRLDIPQEARTILDDIKKARENNDFTKAQELEKTLNEKFPDLFPKRKEGANMQRPPEM